MYAVGLNEAPRLPARVRVNGASDAVLWLDAVRPNVRPIEPNTLPGLRLWLDASQITGLADGDPVAQWNDVSGQGNHATQGTANNRPLYKTGIVNGRPVVRADLVDDALATPLHPNWSAGFTAFAVAQGANTTDNRGIMGNRHNVDGSASGRSTWWTLGTPNGSPLLSVEGEGGGSQQTTTDIVAQFGIATVSSPGNSLEIWGNGVAAAPLSVTDVGGALDYFGLFSWHGLSDGRSIKDIAEIIVFNRALSDAERMGVEAYFSQKYAITGPMLGVTSDGDPTGVWADRSRYGNHATQGTAAQRPLFKVGILNGRPVVRFDGGNDFLCASSLVLGAPLTCFVVGKRTADLTNYRIWLSAHSGAGASQSQFATTATSGEQYVSTTGGAMTGTAWGTGFNIAGFTGTALYKNGAENATGTTTLDFTNLFIGIFFDGVNYPFGGDMAEIILYAGTLPNAWRKRVERYLSRKYAIALEA